MEHQQIDTSSLTFKPEPKPDAHVKLRYCAMCEEEHAHQKCTGTLTGGYEYTYWVCRNCGNQSDLRENEK